MSSEAEEITARSYTHYLQHSSPYTPYLSLRLTSTSSFLFFLLSLNPLLFYPPLLHLHYLPSIYLPASTLRYILHLHIHSWPLVLRHPLPYFTPYLLLSPLATFFLHQVAHQPSLCSFSHSHYHRFLHSCHLPYHSLYLHWLYPVAPHLHLLVCPSQVLYRSVLSVPAHVSRLV